MDASSLSDMGTKDCALVEELRSLDFHAMQRVIRKQNHRTIEGFQCLLKARMYSAAVEYEYRDGCCLDQSILIGAFGSIVEVMR